MNHSLSLWAIPAALLAAMTLCLTAMRRRRHRRARRIMRRAGRTLTGMASVLSHMSI